MKQRYDGAYYHRLYAHNLGSLFQRKTLHYDYNTSADSNNASGWGPRYQMAVP
jgi:hypothetical protein